MRALSIRQPWAWLIVNGHKDIENRTWLTSERGTVLVHAGLTMTKREYQECIDFVWDVSGEPPITLPAFDALQRGGIVGQVDIVGSRVNDGFEISPWFVGEVGFELANGKPLPFVAWRGSLGFFNVPWPLPATPIAPIAPDLWSDR